MLPVAKLIQKPGIECMADHVTDIVKYSAYSRFIILIVIIHEMQIRRQIYYCMNCSACRTLRTPCLY